MSTEEFEPSVCIQIPRYKKIMNKFSAKFKKNEIWFNKLDFVKRILYVNLVEEGTDKFIQQDKSEVSKDYIIVKIYLTEENK